MDAGVKVKVHISGGEGLYITLQEDTAAEVLADVLPQVPGAVGAKQLHSSNYAVFLRISRSTEHLCERMLSAFECPLKLVVVPSQTADPSEIQFLHIVEKQEQGSQHKLSAVEKAFEAPTGMIVHQGASRSSIKTPSSLGLDCSTAVTSTTPLTKKTSSSTASPSPWRP
jgi:hypothetical protein